MRDVEVLEVLKSSQGLDGGQAVVRDIEGDKGERNTVQRNQTVPAEVDVLHGAVGYERKMEKM